MVCVHIKWCVPLCMYIFLKRVGPLAKLYLKSLRGALLLPHREMRLGFRAVPNIEEKL